MESNQNINCHFSQNSSNESNCNLAENKIEKNPENPKPKIEVKSENSISQNFDNYKRSEHSSFGLPSLGENDIKSGKEESEKKLDKTSEIKENENNTSQTIDLTSTIDEMRKELNSTKDVLSKKLDLQNQQINGLRKDFKDELIGLRKDFKDELTGLRKDFKDELKGLRTELSSDLKEIINLLKKK